eukprot:m.28776 g.28776  ORF g.28776 m.28776 type:complete len:401 (-) comp4545_c0_seq1:210-1412(-)
MDRWTYQKEGDDWKGVLGVSRSDSASGGAAPLLYEKNVRLYDGDDRSAFEHGTITLTAHQLYWTDVQGAHGNKTIELHLSHVTGVETQLASLFSNASPKVVLQLSPITSTERASRPMFEWVRATVRANHCKLGFTSKDTAEHVTQMIKDVVAAAAWKSVKVAASKRYGVSARVARDKQEIEKSESSIREAFQGDLEELKRRAKDMVKLSEQFTAKVRKGEVSDSDTAEFQSYVVSLGISDPITKKACGGNESKFHRELATELATFLAEPIANAKGLMLLQDVYCLYNRARGTMLISPDDLVAAASLLEAVGAPLTLRTFDTGVKAIQAAGQSDAAMAERVSGLVAKAGHMSAPQLAQQEDVSVTLAHEMLLASERVGATCRDDTIEGLAFFPNRFLTDAT